MTTDFGALSIRGLLSLHSSALDELRHRKVIRSSNNPIGDYAELLFQKALGLQLAAKSTKGHDAIDQLQRRYEIKGRRLSKHNRSRQLSPLRCLDQKHFDFLAGVLFAEDFSVMRACLVPHDQALVVATYRSHAIGWILHLRDSIWELPGVIDLTEQLRQVQMDHR